jgi:hypothetical protein
MASRKKKRRRGRRASLVYAHLEGISRDLLEEHPDIVRQFIGRNAGVYALYRKDKLYYVGLATGLRGRLRAHSKNRHSKAWDRFSIYLTMNDQHLREIEALILRIAKPIGAKQSGKFAQPRDMWRKIKRAIREKRNRELDYLFARSSKSNGLGLAKAPRAETRLLIQLIPNGAKLRATNSGKIYRARLRRDGTVRFKGKTFSSLSVSATKALGHPVNGWWFWQVERGRHNWVRLTKIRKAGTPIEAR